MCVCVCHEGDIVSENQVEERLLIPFRQCMKLCSDEVERKPKECKYGVDMILNGTELVSILFCCCSTVRNSHHFHVSCMCVYQDVSVTVIQLQTTLVLVVINLNDQCCVI